MADIVGSLFGVTPNMVQAENTRPLFNRAMEFAQLNPMQQAQYGIYSGGALLGQGLGSLMGGEDPRLVQAKQMEQVKQFIAQNNLDMSTAEGVAKAAEYARQNNMVEGAYALGQQAAKMRQEEAQTYATLKKADAEKLSTFGRMLVDAGYTPGTPEFQAAMQKAAQAELTGKAKGDGVNINLGGVFDKMFTKQQAETEGKAVAERIDKLGSVVANVPQRTRDIDTILKVLPDSFTGFGATQLKDLSKAAKQLGIPVSDKASNTEILSALTTRFVLDLGKVFPGSQSNYELQTIQNTQPNALQDPRTIKRLLQQAKQDYRIAQEQYKDAQTYKKANQGTFAGYDLATGQAQASQRVIAQDEYEALSAKAARTGRLTPQEAARAKQLEQQLNIGR